MIEPESYSTLEQAINSRLRLESLCSKPFTYLTDFRIADFVSNYRLRPPRGVSDSESACAQVFFEDNAPFLTQIKGAERGRDYNIVLFATFVVIEFDVYSSQAHFLVLAPDSPPAVLVDAPYAGLWAAQRMDKLNKELDPSLLFEEVDHVIRALLPPIQKRTTTAQRTWWRRLMGR